MRLNSDALDEACMAIFGHTKTFYVAKIRWNWISSWAYVDPKDKDAILSSLNFDDVVVIFRSIPAKEEDD